MSDPALNVDRVLDLAEAVCDEIASQNDFVELNSILLADKAPRRHYWGYCRMHVMLEMELQANDALDNAFAQDNLDSFVLTPWESDALMVAIPSSVPSASPTLPFLSHTLHTSLGYFSEGMPLAYLLATVITGLGLLVGSLIHVSGPEQVTLVPKVVVEPGFVGRITGMVDCKWNGGSRVSLGQKVDLASGLLEITYDTGAKVILQGPVTYSVESNGGYLAVGKLTGKMEKRGERRAERVEKRVVSGQSLVASEGSSIQYSAFSIQHSSSNPQSLIPNPFVIRTPTATVIDLGTEFNVEVKPDQATEVHVVRGTVEAVHNGRTGETRTRERLVAGEAIRFASLTAPPERITGRSVGATVVMPPSKVWHEVKAARLSRLLLKPVGLVASGYHRVLDTDGKLLAENDRSHAFQVATDGKIISGQDDAPASSFDTLDANHLKTDFVGLRYGHPTRFDRIKVFLGRQTSAGGGWSDTPRVFILKNPVDTGSRSPESDPANWGEVPVRLLYGPSFDALPNASPGQVLEFVLTNRSVDERTGYGWAVGGVGGNGQMHYVSITELRAYGAESDVISATNGLVLHLDAALGVAHPSDIVSAWADQSSYGNDFRYVAESYSGGSPPTYVSSNANFNGLPSIYFAQTRAPDPVTFNELVASKATTIQTLFVVVDPINEPYINGLIGTRNLDGIRQATQGTWDDWAGGAHSAQLSVNGGTPASTAPGTFGVPTVLVAQGLFTTDANTILSLGHSFWDSERGFGGNIAEVVGYSGKLTDTETTAIVRYLGAKYHIAVRCPVRPLPEPGATVLFSASGPSSGEATQQPAK